MKNSNKIVVFDLDETLGYFVEFGMFWETIINYLNYKNKNTNTNINEKELNQEQFNLLLDLYPEFCRPEIIKILAYLKEQKEKCICNKIMIYTNNQGPREWVENIKNYFESKIKYKLFDQIIAAFKVNGKTMEICRSSHIKSHKDLVKCSKIPLHTHICFLDDTFYHKMNNNNIYYINIKPYTYDLSFETIISRFINSPLINDDQLTSIKDNKKEFKEYSISFMENYQYLYKKKTAEEFNIDKNLSNKILEHLQLFFNMPFKMNTRKNNYLYHSKKSKEKTKKRK
jgi:hypothetical protein